MALAYTVQIEVYTTGTSTATADQVHQAFCTFLHEGDYEAFNRIGCAITDVGTVTQITPDPDMVDYNVID